METCSPASQTGAEWGTGNLENWLQEGWEPGLGMYLDGRKLCFNQLGVPAGPGRECACKKGTRKGRWATLATASSSSN